MTNKPSNPRQLLKIGIWNIIKPSTFLHIDNFLEEKKNAPLKERDATGLFLAYLQVHAKISTFKISGRFDVGNLEQYIECSNAFSS